MKLSPYSTDTLREIIIQYLISLEDGRDIDSGYFRAFIESLPKNSAFLKECRYRADECIRSMEANR